MYGRAPYPYDIINHHSLTQTTMVDLTDRFSNYYYIYHSPQLRRSSGYFMQCIYSTEMRIVNPMITHNYLCTYTPI